MTEMYIENQKADVSSEISTLITFAIDDIKDFSARNSSFSKTIVLPGTKTNNTILGHIFDVRTSNPYDAAEDNEGINFNPSVTARCIIFQDNIQVFKGIFRVLEIIIVNGVPEYECAVFGELGGLVSAIGSALLEDLDFSTYDRGYSITNVSGSWDNTPGSGVYFPLIDYGLVSTDKIDFDILAFRPALYVKEYIDKIFEAADYTYTSDLFDTDRFKRLVIPNNQKLLYNKQTLAMQAIKTGGTFTGTSDFLLPFTALQVAGGFALSGGNTIFTYTGATIIGNIVFTIHVNSIVGFAPPWNFQLLHNGVEIANQDIVLDTAPPGDITFGPIYLNIANADTISINVTPPPFGSPSLEIGTSILYVNNNVPSPVQVNYNETIKINGGIPQNILQVDFLSSIIKLFNLYVYEDQLVSKRLIITPYVDFYNTNVSGVTSWDYKLDRGLKQSLKPMSELNSRFYNFKFKPDADYYNDLYQKNYNTGFGDYVYDSAFQFAKDKTNIELIFSASPLVGYSGVDKIMVAIYKITNTTVEEHIGSNIRILQTKKVTGVDSWALKNGVTTLSTQTVYGYAGNYDDPDVPANDIHFGVPKELYFTLVSGAINVDQFNVYWSPYMAEITDKDSVLLTASFKLTNKDIYNLDFSSPVYINGVYWRLNKVEDWNAHDPGVTKCELLKIINLIY
jgi:hypothetical protein